MVKVSEFCQLFVAPGRADCQRFWYPITCQMAPRRKAGYPAKSYWSVTEGRAVSGWWPSDRPTGHRPLATDGVSARDLVHAAVMQRLGVSRIISADTDFDRLEGIDRLDPIRIEEWEDSILSANED